MKSSGDVIIIGAGIIGCAIAYRLAKHGLKVTVFEKDQPGRQASWAAAGMLAPYAEVIHSNPDSLTELLDASHSLYPSFVSELENETGINIGFESTGSVVVAKDYEETKLLAGVMERHNKAHKSIQGLSAQELREIEPDLAESLQAGLYFHQDYFVNPRRLTTTLVAAATKNSVKFIANTPVLGLQVHKNRVAGVKVSGEVIQGGTIINAAGCWAGMIDKADEIYLPVRPIRGQIVELENRPQSLHHLIHSTGCYLVPWPDGRVLIGSTLENVGFNQETTAQGVEQLLSAAIEIVPKLASNPIRNFWAGLRPDTPDNLPLLGATRVSNYIIATGHFRNGILLAPITAKIIADLVLSGKSPKTLEPFRPDRFAP